MLDIGCGKTPLFLMKTRFREKYGLDQSAQEDLCWVHEHGIRLIRHDMEKETSVPFPDGYFDVVTMLAVVEHLEPKRLGAILREIHRVLKSGGKFILTTPAFWTDRLLRILARLSLVSSVEIEDHKAAYRPSDISAFLQEAGFPPTGLRSGTFELFMNLWAVATK